MRSKLRKTIIAVILFLIGYGTQTCLVNMSNMAKLKDAIECTSDIRTTGGSEAYACYGNKQNTPTAVLLNSFNPSAKLVDELILQMAISSDMSSELKKCLESQKTKDTWY